MLILASNSPRRKKIMELLNLEFTTMAPNDDAEPEVNSFSDAIIAARVKAYDVAENLSDEIKSKAPIIIGADTIVVINGTVLGKPKNKEEAFNMLSELSNKTHTVATGLSLVKVYGPGKDNLEAFSTIGKTEVVFRELSETEITKYIDGGEPMDKAGAYAIQGDGSIFVDSIHGCYNNVVGLPTSLLLDQLSQLGY